MSEQNPDVQDQWAEAVEQLNDAVGESIEHNLESQAAFIESWAEAMNNATPEEGELASGIEGYNRSYEVWMDAADQVFDRLSAAAEGEQVAPQEFRDIWLQSANEAFKEIMGTAAFAAANGQLVEAMLEMRQRTDEITEETVAQLGFPTRTDVDEVGERLLELERRQHAVEEKLDEILDSLED